MQINNWIASTDSPTAQSFQKINPYTHEPLYSVSQSTVLDIVRALQVAQKSYLEWKDSNLWDRLQLLNKIIQAYQENQKELIQLESLDQALSLDFTDKANYRVGLQYLLQMQAELQSPDLKFANYKSVGVISILLSWNLSNRLFIDKVISAIMAGNTVLVKLSSVSPGTALIWIKIFTQAGLPTGLVQFVFSNERNVQELLLTHPGIKAVVMTADLKNTSLALQKIASLAERQFKKIQIGSGSKNPAIALLEPTSSTVQDIFESFMMGQGQLHWNSARLFVTEKNQKLWTEALSDYLNQLKPVSSVSEEGIWRPVLKSRSFENFQDILQQARKDQAKLMQVGIVSEGLSDRYLAPTWTKDMSNCSTLQQDQMHAPLYIISEVKYPFDIPKYSNVSYYGDSASIWFSEKRPDKVIDQLDVGFMSLNKWSVYSPDRYSSVKQSGFGLQDHRIFGAFYSNVKKVSAFTE